MRSSSSSIVAAVAIVLGACVALSARISTEVNIGVDQELQSREMAVQEPDGDEQWDDEEWEADEGNDDDMAVEEEAEAPFDEEPVVDDASGAASKAVCCKCGQVASNGKTVYSCSTGGSCRKCKKYGGQRKAEKLAAPTACANGEKRAHYACRQAFEGGR